MTELERVIKVVDWLVFDNVVKTRRDLADKLKYTESSLSQIINGKVPLSPRFIKRLSILDQRINSNWIEKEEGSMLKDGNEIKSDTLEPAKQDIQPSILQDHIIRYYDVEATAGNVEVFDDAKATYKNIVIPGFDDCDFALNVLGDSMYPELKSGQIAILKEWKEPYIEFGHTYMVVTKTGHRMIKRLRSSKQKDEVICESANEIYDSFELKKEDITKLFLVKGHVERSAI